MAPSCGSQAQRCEGMGKGGCAASSSSRAPVPLEGAPDTEFAVFRGGEGMRDQVAIVVGKPDPLKPVPIRLHSACLTGDLFGSLKCDCGDQLRGTVRRMAEDGGGVLLYLDQEGRGNGIANKIRAYKLQAQGFDTYDADEVLGFDQDQRRFDFAAEMLHQLGVHGAVCALTNNPQKIAALRRAGFDVVSEGRVLGRATAENVRYLATKRDRAGHYIDFASPAALAPAQDYASYLEVRCDREDSDHHPETAALATFDATSQDPYRSPRSG